MWCAESAHRAGGGRAESGRTLTWCPEGVKATTEGAAKGSAPAPPCSYDGSVGEYDPLLRAPPSLAEIDDLARTRDLFATASQPFLSWPWTWLAWAIVLPVTALTTRIAIATFGALVGGLGLWSLAILLGGVVELVGMRRGSRDHRRTALAGWALNVQGNLSLVAVALSLAALLAGQGRLLPGIWLLLLGHSFFMLGSLAFPPFRACGLIYQLGGVVALWPSLDPLLVFAAASAAGNLWMAWSVWRLRR